MEKPSASMSDRIAPVKSALLLSVLVLVLATSCAGQAQGIKIEEITFTSGEFRIVGDLRLPAGRGPFPVVVFVHGDGPNNRTAGGSYLPIMERMASAGFATFAWDKPGTGESTGQIDRTILGIQRARIVLEAIEVLKKHASINPDLIGMWGISQAGYVMPRVLLISEGIAFVIAVSCPGMAGVDQGAYLVSAQAICSGSSAEEAEKMRQLLSEIEKVETYPEYVQYKTSLDALPGINLASVFGYKTGVLPETEWHEPNLGSEYFWNPMEVIEHVKIPVLVFFGEKDTQVDPIQGSQAYEEAFKRAGNTNYRIELIPDSDHNMILSKTGCLDEREARSAREWTNYAPEYLDILEGWLRKLLSE